MIRRTGTILIVTLWVILVLAALTLVLARSMRVEATCSANELSGAQAQAVEQAAEQYVLAHVAGLKGAMPSATDMACEQIIVGPGAFWIVQPLTDDDRTYAFGLTDESSKLNLNVAPSPALLKLPAMTEELAACIVDWRDADSTVTAGGAESEYYLLLADPYQCKNADLETVDELFLVKGATRQVVYGEDLNRNGVLDANENDGDASDPPDNRDGKLDRGIAPYVTVYSVEPNTSSDGQPRININDPAQRPQFTDLLRKNLPASKADPLIASLRRSQPPFMSTLDFHVRAKLTQAEFAKLADRLTTSPAPTLRGLINVNTAPKEVLLTLPGLEESDAATLISKRADSSADLTNLAWVAGALTPQKAAPIGSLITTRASRYSADIVAVSADGRAFKRCRIVVDAGSSQGSPKVIYRQDLTHLGWPLAAETLAQLRGGMTLDQLATRRTGLVGLGNR